MAAFAHISVASAQGVPPRPSFTDEAVRQTIDLALRNIDKGICGASACAPATPTELASPPVTIADGRRAMDTALDSAAAKWCGVANSERIFHGFMGYTRMILKYDDRKTSLLALIHGITMGQAARALAARGQCPSQFRQQLESLAGRTFNR